MTTTFKNNLIESLSEKHLLNHPFYQAWNDGNIPIETLQTYASQYFHHVSAFPRYLSAAHSNCESLPARQVLLENLVEEESGEGNHPELWLRFLEGIGGTRAQALQAAGCLLPQTKALIETFMNRSRSSYAEGLGVLFAYEHQVPEIATFKMKALREHYGISDARTLTFFEVHRTADVHHTNAVAKLIEELSPSDRELAMSAARDASVRLWEFLDGIHGQMCTAERASTHVAQA